MKSISVVIPVFNSENTITTVVENTIKAIHLIEEVVLYEIILVNDGSRDPSKAVCKALSDQYTV